MATPREIPTASGSDSAWHLVRANRSADEHSLRGLRASTIRRRKCRRRLAPNSRLDAHRDLNAHHGSILAISHQGQGNVRRAKWKIRSTKRER
jgi:hypothetical protein